MASTEASIQLPSIDSLKVTRGKSEVDKQIESDKPDNNKLNHAKSYLTGLKLGSLKRQKRPGDVWKSGSGLGSAGVAREPRPLGLIPDRQSRFNTLRELSRLLPPLSIYTRTARVPGVKVYRDQEVKSEGAASRVINTSRSNSAGLQTELVIPNDGGISATVKHTEPRGQSSSEQHDPSLHHPHAVFSNAPPPSCVLGIDNPTGNFRYPQTHQHNHVSEEHEVLRGTDETDIDYLDTLAKCKLGDYYPGLQSHTRHRAQTLPPTHLVMEIGAGTARGRKKLTIPGRSHSHSTGAQFMSFSEQSQLWNRSLADDRRVPLGYEPCERCRERGGRCARCKALRVGGGYIILDGDNLSDNELRKRFGKRYGLGSGYRSSMGSRGDRRSRRKRVVSDDGGTSGVGWSGGGDSGDGGDGVNRQRGTGGLGRGWDGLDGSDVHGRGKGSGMEGRLSSASGRQPSGDGGGRGGDHRDGRSGEGRGISQHDNSYDDDRGVGGAGKGGGGVRGEDGGDGTGGDMSGSRGVSRMSGSRPGSTLGTRPASSLKRRGGMDRRHKGRQNADLERGTGGGHDKGRGGEDGDGGDSSDEDGHGKRRRRRGNEENDDDKSHERLKFKSHQENDDEPRPMSGYHGNMMRFKRKTNDVKAIHATLKELQGIDPLDYLAKYCIIDQTKLPHYRHCYDNVDRDEDDEIDITELDFALKAVNFDLISDTEMNYVHSVLELAGRYRLNFRLFSLIAALSEKVVALEDMVKRIINKMDFEALEVKMKKCKELFYLLADDESNLQHDGGVVTTSSLGVELQAGGLTQDHVEFVVDRLNHEGKGLVEFLDYLTYVPLFVEIHDSISGNPLDFSRTK